MTFSRANAATWGMNEIMSSAQANIIDLNQSRAVDGNAGGSYNPSAPIIVATGKLQAEPAAADIEFQAEYVDHKSHSATRIYPVHDCVIGSRFIVETTNIRLLQNDVTSAGGAARVFRIEPVVGTMTDLFVYLKGAAGHGALPGTMPSMTLIEDVPGVSSTTVVAQTYDTAADTAAYQVLHSIDATGLSISVSANKLYRLVLTGETGANAAVGLEFYSIATRMTVTRGYPG